MSFNHLIHIKSDQIDFMIKNYFYQYKDSLK